MTITTTIPFSGPPSAAPTQTPNDAIAVVLPNKSAAQNPDSVPKHWTRRLAWAVTSFVNNLGSSLFLGLITAFALKVESAVQLFDMVYLYRICGDVSVS
jgi:hypothetical protein